MIHEREYKETECIKVGVEAFVVKNGQLLLGMRKNVAGHGSWALPGGHLEQGEILTECLRRELQEEIGIEVKGQKLVTLDNNPTNVGGHYLHIGFLVEDFEGNINLKEPEKCEEWRFFDIENLPENLFSAHKKEIDLYKRKVLYDNN